MSSGLLRHPTNHEMRQLSKLIALQWKDVARCFRPHLFESHDIANIECEHPRSLTDQSAVMLERWRRRDGKESTVRRLCESLLDAECRLPAEEVFGEELVDRVTVHMNESRQEGQTSIS